MGKAGRGRRTPEQRIARRKYRSAVSFDMEKQFGELADKMKADGCTCKLIRTGAVAVREGNKDCPVHPWQSAVHAAQAKGL